MEFENTFVVDAPVQDVWDLLLDVERVAPCMPGAQVLEQIGEDAYKVAVKVKLGPMTMNYKGDVEILEKDTATHKATMRAKAKEARGQGTASASMRMALQEQGAATQASIITEMQMSGKAAAMGQGVIQDVAATLTDTFAHNLAALVEGAGQPTVEAEAVPPGGERPPSAAEPALPAGEIARSVIASRLRDPRVQAVLIAFLLGLLIGRHRHA
jgi:carbon monoxide dehydrogenase subunit G